MRRKLAAGIGESWYLTDTENNKITFWPGTWMLNVADNAPEINGLKLNKYIARFVAQEILSSGVWDGVFYDNAWKDVKWLAGDALSLADIAAAAHLSAIDYLGDVPWSDHEVAKEWYARIKSRPSFRPLLTDHIPGLAPPKHYTDLDF